MLKEIQLKLNENSNYVLFLVKSNNIIDNNWYSRVNVNFNTIYHLVRDGIITTV